MKKTKNYAMPYPEQDDYFNVEDFQDMMVSVDDLMKKLSDSGAQISSDAEHLYNQTKAQMDNIQKRMNAFTALRDGSTTGDAELKDIRVAYDGKEYGNAGEAVREQASDIHKALFGAGASIWSKAKSESTKYVAETKGICILNERFTAAGVVTKISRGTFAENESTLNLDRECSAYIVEFEKNPGTVYMPSAETIKIVSTTKIIFEANGNARCWIPVEKGQYLAVDSTATAYTSESNHVPYMLYDQANKTLECRGFGSTGSIEPVDPYSLALEYKLEYDMDDTGLVKQIDANREAAASLKEDLEDLMIGNKKEKQFNVTLPMSESSRITSFALTVNNLPATFTMASLEMNIKGFTNVSKVGLQVEDVNTQENITRGKIISIVKGKFTSSSYFYLKIICASYEKANLIAKSLILYIDGVECDFTINQNASFGTGTYEEVDSLSIDDTIKNLKDRSDSVEKKTENLLEAIDEQASVYVDALTTNSENETIEESIMTANASTRFNIDGSTFKSDNWAVSDYIEIGYAITIKGYAIANNVFAVTYDKNKNIKKVYTTDKQELKEIALNINDGIYVKVQSCTGISTIATAERKYTPTFLRTTKKDYTNGYIYFTVNVDTTIPDCSITTDSTKDNPVFKNFWCVLKLPKSYASTGNPTKLAVCMHGAGGVVYDGHPGELSGFSVLCDNENYAILDCNGVDGVTATEGSAEHMGNPVALRAYKKAIDYVVANYNVEDTIYLHGHSMGGLTALNFVNMFPNIVKVLGLHYPVTDLYNQAFLHPWYPNKTKQDLAKYYKFSDVSGATYETEKVIGYNPIKSRTVNIDDKDYTNCPVPLKIWHGNSDTAVNYEYSVKLVDAIKRNGGIADIRVLDGVGHNAGSGAMVTELRRWFNRF